MSQKFKFKIENVNHEWPAQFITGAEIRQIPPGIPDNLDLYVKEKGKSARLIKNEDRFDLSDHSGIDKFFSQEASSTAG